VHIDYHIFGGALVVLGVYVIVRARISNKEPDDYGELTEAQFQTVLWNRSYRIRSYLAGAGFIVVGILTLIHGYY
jgi:hypothetical protein